MTVTNDRTKKESVLERMFPNGCVKVRSKCDIRSDGRKLNETRLLEIKIDTLKCPLVGSSLVVLGGTVVSCVVKPMIYMNPPTDDLVVIEVDNTTMTSFPYAKIDRYKSSLIGDGRPNALARIEYVLRELFGHSIKTEDLAIVGGMAYWRLVVSVVCVKDGGNLNYQRFHGIWRIMRHLKCNGRQCFSLFGSLIDVTNASAGIEHLQFIPKVNLNGPRTHIKTKRNAVSVTFKVIEGSFFVDPNRREELMETEQSASLNVCFNDDLEIVMVNQFGACFTMDESGCSTKLRLAIEDGKKIAKGFFNALNRTSADSLND
ncbi:hypothetical protein ACOME3_001506 [Neoechinorhynchus agilis]